MKKMKFLMIGLLFISLAGFTSCKKEVKIEKNLWKKGGEWSIVKWQNNWAYNGSSNSEVLNNAGTYEFEKGGSGKLTLTADGETYTNLFTYKNTESSLTLVFKEGSMYSEGDSEKYTLDWKKDKINLYSYTSDNWGYDEYKIDLEKN